MSETKKTFTAEFRREAVRLSYESDRTIDEVVCDPGGSVCMVDIAVSYPCNHASCEQNHR